MIDNVSTASTRRQRLLADAGLMAVTVLWALNFSISKLALKELPPLPFNAVRYPLASGVVWLALRRTGPIPWPARRDLPKVVLLGLIGNVVYQLLFIFGLAATAAGTTSLLLAGTPMVTAMLSAFLGHEHVTRSVWVGVSATVIGMVTVATATHAAGAEGTSLKGALTLFGASCSWALYTVNAKPLVERYGPVPVTAWTLWTGTLVLVALGAGPLLRMDLARVSAGAWVGVAYAGILSIGVSYMLWYNGVRHVGNTRTATYSNLVPVVALATAWLWLGETPTPRQLVGAAVILAGVTLARREPAKAVGRW